MSQYNIVPTNCDTAQIEKWNRETKIMDKWQLRADEGVHVYLGNNQYLTLSITPNGLSVSAKMGRLVIRPDGSDEVLLSVARRPEELKEAAP